MTKARIIKLSMLLLAAVSLPWIAHASVLMADAVSSSGFDLRDVARLSSGWEKSPLMIGVAAFALIVAIASRGSERR